MSRRLPRNPWSGERLTIREGTRLREAGFVIRNDVWVIPFESDFVEIIAVFDPSSLELVRRNRTLNVSRRMQRALTQVVHGQRTLANALGSLAAIEDEFYWTYVAEFLYGPYRWSRTSLSDDGSVELGPDSAVRAFLLARARSDEPYDIPVIGARRNEGTDGRCVYRWLGDPDKNLSWLSVVLAHPDVYLYDILGNQICDLWRDPPEVTHVEDRLQPGKKKAVYFCGHVYPVEDTLRCMPGIPVTSITHGNPGQPHHRCIESVVEMLEQRNCPIVRIRDLFHIPVTHEGETIGVTRYHVHCRGSDYLSPTRILRWFPRRGMDPLFKRTLHLGTRPLMRSLSDADTPAFRAAGGLRFITFDRKKCYMNALDRILSQKQIWLSDIMMDFSSDIPVRLRVRSTLAITEPMICIVDYDEELAEYGITHNVMHSDLLVACQKLLRRPLKIKYYCLLRDHLLKEETDGDRILYESMADELKQYAQDTEPASKRRFHKEVGLSIRTNTTQTSWLGIPTSYAFEREWYKKRYGFEEQGSLLVKSHPYHYVRQPYALGWTIIQFAQADVLRFVCAMRERFHVKPVRIWVDEVTYDWKPVQVTARRFLDLPDGEDPFGGKIAEYACSLDDGLWSTKATKNDEVMPKAPGKSIVDEHPIRLSDDHTEDMRSMFSENVTYTGEPGTGKTFRALQDFPDVFERWCYSNRGARRIDGRSVHSAMRWTPHTSEMTVPTISERIGRRLRGKRILIDEAGCLQRWIWSILVELYLNWDVRFVLTMDHNQLPPVCENALPPSFRFLGQHVELVENHRCSVEVQRLYRSVLSTERPDMERIRNFAESTDQAPSTMLNLCFTHDTRVRVNEFVRRWLDLTVYDAGIILVATKTTPHFCTGHRIKRLLEWRGVATSPNWRNLSTGVDFIWNPSNMAHCTTLGYCVTTHAFQGDTAEEPYTIWEIDRFTPNMLYTAFSRARNINDIHIRFGAPLIDEEPDAIVQNWF